MKQNTKNILMIAGLFFVLAVVLYSCGGGGGGSSYGGGGGTPAATVQVVACPASGTTTDISIVSVALGFSPSSVGPLPVNTTVKWTNVDTMTHTVTSTSVPLYGTFNETVNPGTSVCLKFTSAGTFNYHCSIPSHSTMPTGVVIVQ